MGKITIEKVVKTCVVVVNHFGDKEFVVRIPDVRGEKVAVAPDVPALLDLLRMPSVRGRSVVVSGVCGTRSEVKWPEK